MGFAPRRDSLVIVAVGDRAAHDQQQDFRQRVRHPPRRARVFDDREMIQKRPTILLTTFSTSTATMMPSRSCSSLSRIVPKTKTCR